MLIIYDLGLNWTGTALAVIDESDGEAQFLEADHDSYWRRGPLGGPAEWLNIKATLFTFLPDCKVISFYGLRSDEDHLQIEGSYVSINDGMSWLMVLRDSLAEAIITESKVYMHVLPYFCFHFGTEKEVSTCDDVLPNDFLAFNKTRVRNIDFRSIFSHLSKIFGKVHYCIMCDDDLSNIGDPVLITEISEEEAVQGLKQQALALGQRCILDKLGNRQLSIRKKHVE